MVAANAGERVELSGCDDAVELIIGDTLVGDAVVLLLLTGGGVGDAVVLLLTGGGVGDAVVPGADVVESELLLPTH